MLSICIASGCSLTKDDVDYCKGKGRVYVVSDNHRLAPWADVLYSCDAQWWDFHLGAPKFIGEKWCLEEESAKRWGLNHIKQSKEIVSFTLGEIGTGGNSGYQAINLAVLQGAKKIILLGYDMKLGEHKRSHWFGEHPAKLTRSSRHDEWVNKFNLAAPFYKEAGIEIINCTKDTALECFERKDLRDVI
jgi:hypothetical protein